MKISIPKKLEIEKGIYQKANEDGKTFTQALEEFEKEAGFDSSEFNAQLKDGQKTDAYQRQCMAHGIKLSGANASLIEDFYKTNSNKILFPELINRNLLIGLNNGRLGATLNDILAATSTIKGNVYKGVEFDVEGSTLEYSRVTEGSNIPTVIGKTKETNKSLEKIGLGLQISYEAIRRMQIPVFAATLQVIGWKFGQKMIGEALDVLINGDGNSNPAISQNVASSGTITFTDLLNLEMEFDDFEPEILIADKATMKKILLISEFRDPLIGSDFLTKGRMTTPFGNKMFISKYMPANKVLAFNRQAGVEMVEEQSASIVEVEKIINKQIEQTFMTKTIGFSKLWKNSAYILSV